MPGISNRSHEGEVAGKGCKLLVCVPSRRTIHLCTLAIFTNLAFPFVLLAVSLNDVNPACEKKASRPRRTEAFGWDETKSDNFRVMNYGNRPVHCATVKNCERLRTRLAVQLLGESRVAIGVQSAKWFYILATRSISASSDRVTGVHLLALDDLPRWPDEGIAILADSSPPFWSIPPIRGDISA